MKSTVVVEELTDGLMRTRGARVNLAFRVRGVGQPIILLHGTSANHAVWDPVSERLSRAHKVICVDQRGHGRSDKPQTGYRGSDFASDIAMLLDALSIESAVVAGHSLGARNSWVFGALYPERTASVACIDYTPWVANEPLEALATRVSSGNQEFIDVSAIEKYLHDRYPRLPSDAISRRALWGYTKSERGTWIPLASPNALNQLVDGLNDSWAEEFSTFAAPAVHIRGVDSAFVDTNAWNQAKKARPSDRWVESCADHYVPEELPDLVSDEIEELVGSNHRK